MAKRIQRQRTKGWRMPGGAIYVGRPTVWGNPFIAESPCGIFAEGVGFRGQAETLIPCLTLDQAVEFYRDMIRGFVRPEMHPFGHNWMKRFHKTHRGFDHPSDAARRAFKGKSLVCWCALDQPCHADVLLEIANG